VRRRAALALAVVTACGCGAPGRALPSIPPPVVSPVATPSATTTTPAPPVAPRRASPSPTHSARSAPAKTASLAGVVVGIDPGHNGGNGADPAYINRQVWNGRAWEACDTTGTQTAGGFTESLFNFDVALDLAADLRAEGATVVFTRSSNTGVGPCIDRRASIINHAHATVAVDIHADGGPSSGRGFTVIEPVDDGINHAVLAASDAFGTDVRDALVARTAMPVSDYYGVDGIIHRSDLAGLNLTTVPKVLIECGNMRNATDAALLVSAGFQRAVAAAFASAIARFVRSENGA
jgi:N-acetylmuramoyl-L-alanine amidase